MAEENARSVEVIQADRDAAAKYLRAIPGFPEETILEFVAGGYDHLEDALPLAFARHRLAFAANPGAREVEGLRIWHGSANSHVFDDQILIGDDCIAFSDEPWTSRIFTALATRAENAETLQPPPSTTAGEVAIREAAKAVIDNASWSYRSRGKERYIEDESGERMVLVPHEDWALLEGALSALAPAPGEGS